MFGFVPIFVGFVVLSRKLSGGKKFWMSDVSSRCKEHVIGTRYVGNHARLEIRYRHRKNSAPGNFHFLCCILELLRLQWPFSVICKNILSLPRRHRSSFFSFVRVFARKLRWQGVSVEDLLDLVRTAPQGGYSDSIVEYFGDMGYGSKKGDKRNDHTQQGSSKGGWQNSNDTRPSQSSNSSNWDSGSNWNTGAMWQNPLFEKAQQIVEREEATAQAKQWRQEAKAAVKEVIDEAWGTSSGGERSTRRSPSPRPETPKSGFGGWDFFRSLGNFAKRSLRRHASDQSDRSRGKRGRSQSPKVTCKKKKRSRSRSSSRRRSRSRRERPEKEGSGREDFLVSCFGGAGKKKKRSRSRSRKKSRSTSRKKKKDRSVSRSRDKKKKKDKSPSPLPAGAGASQLLAAVPQQDVAVKARAWLVDQLDIQGKIGDEELKSEDWVTPVCYHASQTKLRDLANTIKTTVDSSMRSYGSKHEILLRMIPHAIVAAK
jgi:hypothetical protein